MTAVVSAELVKNRTSDVRFTQPGTWNRFQHSSPAILFLNFRNLHCPWSAGRGPKFRQGRARQGRDGARHERDKTLNFQHFNLHARGAAVAAFFLSLLTITQSGE